MVIALLTSSPLFLFPRAQAQAQTPKVPQKFALLVGINDYPNERDKLKGCVNDVTQMKKSLVDNFGFAPENIITLTDAQATRQGIIDHFRSDLRDQAKTHRDAVVLFYFSGHGQEIPDNDGDEARYGDRSDTLDESLCAIDTNLRDDDVNVLYRELTPYTQNATFIFDSCHSGTGTRGPIVADAPRIKEKFTPFVPPVTAAAPLNITDKTGANGGNGKPSPVPSLAKADDDALPRSGNWIQIAGCAPMECSTDDSFDGVAQGTLTYYLLQAMNRATSRTTNGEIWQETARGVSARRATQHPQLEGVARAPFLGGATRLEAPPVRYAVQGNEIIVDAGLNQGAKVGGYVALKTPDAPAPLRLAIRQTTATRATLAVPDGTTLPPSGEAQLLTPYFGIEAITVRLNKAMEAPIATALKGLLNAPDNPINLLRVVDGEEKAQLEVGYGPRGAVDSSATGNSAKEMVYYVSEGSQILYHAFFTAKPNPVTGDVDIPASLQRTLENYAQQRNLQTLSNAASALDGNVVLSLLNVPNKSTVPDDFQADEDKPMTPIADQNGTYRIGRNAGFVIQLKNTGTQHLYASIVAISNDGSITLIPDLESEDKTNFDLAPASDAKNSVAQSMYCLTTAPWGMDSYKVLISAQPTDWSWLERERVRTRGTQRDPKTAFEALLGVASAGMERGVRQDSAPSKLDFNSWGNIDFKVQVN